MAAPGYPFEIDEPPARRYVRSPLSALATVVGVSLAAVAALVLSATDTADFRTLFGDLLATAPRWVVSAVVGTAQLAFFVPAILGFVGLLATRRFRRVGRMLMAAALCVAGLALVAHLVGTSTFSLLPARGPRPTAGVPPAGPEAYGVGSLFPTTIDLAVIGAWWFVDAAHWAPTWRRVGAVALVLGVVAHLGVQLAAPAAIFTTLLAAFAAAQIVDMVTGHPNTRPTAADVGERLRSLGHRVTSVGRFGGFTGFEGFRVATDDGTPMFVKVVHRDSWAGLVPLRLLRSVRFRDSGDQPAFRSLRSGVEHEALAALKSYADGVPTPRVAVVTSCGPNAMLMGVENPSFTSLATLPAERRDHGVLRGVWRVVAALQEHHTAHRRCNADVLMVDDDGDVKLVGFGAAELGVSGPMLATDVAEALALSAALFGVEATVDEATRAVGPDRLTEALPRLQPLALTRSTRDLVKATGVLDELREAVRQATGAEDVALAELHRVAPKTLLGIAMTALVLWTLIPQLTGIGSVWGELGDANWWWAPAVLALSIVTYVGAAVALDGSVIEDLPLLPNVGAQFATSFVAVAAPGGALALTARFLQKRGIDPATAAAAVGVDTVAGAIVHVLLTAVFVSFAGTSGLGTFSLPSAATIAVVAAVLALVVIVGMVVPPTRRALSQRVVPAVRRAVGGLGTLVRQPAKMAELFGGSLAITLGNILGLAAAVAAFGGGPAFTSVALVYLVGSAVSSVAPTPGGVGAVEATLIGGLTSAGMGSAPALGAVLVFRLATFWLPLIPGSFAFGALQRSGDL